MRNKNLIGMPTLGSRWKYSANKKSISVEVCGLQVGEGPEDSHIWVHGDGVKWDGSLIEFFDNFSTV